MRNSKKLSYIKDVFSNLHDSYDPEMDIYLVDIIYQ